MIRRLPLIGYVVRCLEADRFRELALFGSNVVMALILLGLTFGYAAISVVVLAMTGIVASLILFATVG